MMARKTDGIVPYGAVVPAGKRDIALRPGQVYITHEQAAAIQGESSFSPNSALGALFELHFALLRATTKRGAGKGNDKQLDLDFSDNAKFGLMLQTMMAHGRNGGLRFARPRTGTKRLFGKEMVPLGEAAELLPETTQLHRKDGTMPFDRAWHLETSSFMEFLHREMEMAEQYLSPKEREALLGRLQANMSAIGFSANTGGLLPQITGDAPTTNHRTQVELSRAPGAPSTQIT